MKQNDRNKIDSFAISYKLVTGVPHYNDDCCDEYTQNLLTVAPADRFVAAICDSREPVL